MSSILEFLGAEPLAILCGAIGLTCQLVWPLMRSRRAILSVQFGIGAGYGVQYALLGATCGAGICFLGATQTGVAFLAGDRPWLRRVGLGFLPLIWVMGVMTWDGVSSLLALTACSLTMLGRLQQRTLTLRCFLLAAAPFGIGYDLLVGALPALCGAIVSAAVSALVLFHEMRKDDEGDEFAYMSAAGLLV